MAATSLHISLSAEPILYIGNFAITNSMFTSVVISAVLITFAFLVNRALTNTNKPKGVQNFVEMVIESLFNLTYSVTGDMRKAMKFFPLVSTFFLFIILNNWFGLIPGVGSILVPEAIPPAHASTEGTSAQKEVIAVDAEHGETVDEMVEGENAPAEEHPLVPLFRPGTSDLNTTIALGLVSVIAIQLFGYGELQFGYFKKFINFSSPIMFFVGFLEIISEFAKIISFAFRLFGNIFAGEVLLVVISSLISILAPVPFYGLEVFVGFIQALVFSMLSLVLMNMATMSHDEH